MPAKIAKDMVVEISFELYDDKKQLLDKAPRTEPMPYIHGKGQILPAIEEILEGKENNFTTNVTLRADQAFGTRNDDLVVELPKDHFPADVELAVGMAFNTTGPNGEPIIVEIINIDGDRVTVDGNHPLAGMDLEYRLEVINVREATKEELEHGHVHKNSGGSEPVH